MPDGFSSQRTSIAETVVDQEHRNDAYIDPDIRRPDISRASGGART
jgi:hypothetical protein